MAAATEKIQIACVRIVDFPLQLAMRSVPDHFQLPIALIDRNDARATVIAVDSRAKKQGIYPGLLYAKAAALCPELHAVPFYSQLMEHAHHQLMHQLNQFSPAVEPVTEQPGTYYLDMRGMHRMHPDLHAWGERVQAALLTRQKLNASVVIGFTRFGVLTVSGAGEAFVLFHSVDEELQTASSVALSRLNIRSDSVRELARLGVRTVRDLQALPPSEVRCRFSQELSELVRKSKDTAGFVQAVHLPDPYDTGIELDYAEGSETRILDIIRHLYTPLLKKMKQYSEGVSEIHLHLTRDFGGSAFETVKTAEPTVDEPVIADLVRLKLSAVSLRDKIVAVSIRIITAQLPDAQQNLCDEFAKSDDSLLAANRALARVAAEFGPRCAQRICCTESHLAENSFSWELFDTISAPVVRTAQHTTAVRRILETPSRISTPRRKRLHKVFGPYSINGFWWRKTKVNRQEYFVETESGDTQWIFYDQLKHQWYRRGFVQ